MVKFADLTGRRKRKQEKKQTSTQTEAEAKKRILVVDDEPHLLETAKDRLEFKGYKVITALDGEEGLRKALKHIPDLIILDILMPRLTGIEVLEKLKQAPQTKHIPVIMLTGKDKDEDMVRGWKFGADYYLTKPFSFEQLFYGINLMFEAEKQKVKVWKMSD